MSIAINGSTQESGLIFWPLGDRLLQNRIAIASQHSSTSRYSNSLSRCKYRNTSPGSWRINTPFSGTSIFGLHSMRSMQFRR
ncbi:hypothetical protein PN498_07045 [Oscillatoria sp. CS-180]|uniref:hypothetical protein n=1 Tax=Oscillatoria sp. CS-180 TaxID=3021720 RepID=UPI00232E3014|nr:hypothetical protein [Oscillatoria sp. CS-180]MDB9525738.1 hypothetical protein [Oscillatoria sp. CS-180]